MPRNKIFRARRGMRFNPGVLGVEPAAGFVGGAIDSPAVMTGSVMTSVTSDDVELFYPVDSAGKLPTIRSTFPAIDSSVSFGRADARDSLNDSLIGSTAPTWTRSYLGQNQAYIESALTSSRHEQTNLNARASGSASFSKKQSLKTYIAKRTASLNDLVPGHEPTYLDVLGSDGYPQQTGANVVYPACSTFVASSGTLCELTGSGFRDFGWDAETFIASPNAPAVFDINVPIAGKLVDIKVWVELHHASGTMSGVLFEPLSCMAISLRSPNVHFRSALPIENDEKFMRWGSGSVHHFDFLGVGLTDDGIPHRLYSSAYLLWEGAAVAGQTATSLSIVDTLPTLSGNHLTMLERGRYPTFNTDRSMRVVFSDGAAIPNPRHLIDGVSVSGNYVGSPAEGAGINSAWGAETNWISTTGSPPRGWLSGPASTAAVNEWNTTGSNVGALEMRPVYPLLDDVYEVKRVGSDSTYANAANNAIFETHFGTGYINSGPPSLVYTAQNLFNDATQWRGFRPGLRGSEISGTWRLNVAAYPYPTPGQFPGDSYGSAPKLYFRQVRLELTYEEWGGLSDVRNSPRLSPIRPGRRLVSLISGSSNMRVFNPSFMPESSASFFGPGGNYYVNEVYTTSPEQGGIGRSFGVTAHTGSFREDGYALLYRLSGALGDLSGTVPGWLLGGPGGMPQLPESSSSLVPPVPETIPPRTNSFLPQAGSPPKTLEAAAEEINPRQKRTRIAQSFVSSSSR